MSVTTAKINLEKAHVDAVQYTTQLAPLAPSVTVGSSGEGRKLNILKADTVVTTAANDYYKVCKITVILDNSSYCSLWEWCSVSVKPF